MQLQFNY